MSKTYSIACKDCEKHLWIAQGWKENNFYIYFGQEKTMECLRVFLWKHKGHNLIFDENTETDIADYEEIDPEL